MRVLEAQCFMVLASHDHPHINKKRAFAELVLAEAYQMLSCRPSARRLER